MSRRQAQGRTKAARFSAAVAIAAVTSCSANANAAPDPLSHLSCEESQIVSAAIDHDDTTVETRTPEQQATQFAASQGKAFEGSQKVVYKSDERIDIAFVGADDKTTGVLSYQYDDKLGWRLQQTLSCS